MSDPKQRTSAPCTGNEATHGAASGADPAVGLSRRDLLRAGAALGAGVALAPFAAHAAVPSGPPKVRRYVRLGRTGLEVDDIGFGSSRLSGDEALVRYALDHGINYLDTAEDYTGGSSEETIGRALSGQRDRYYLASKQHAGAGDTRRQMMERLEGSLRRLRTDHIDVYFNHAVNDVARMQNPEWAEFVAAAKKAGKIRFSGMSGHGGRLVECIDYALDHDLVDVLLVGYNFGQDPGFMARFTKDLDFVALQPELPRVLEKAKQKDVGVVAMKTLRGARLNDMRPYEREGGTFAQAAFRWTLSSPNVDALVVTMKSTEMVDEYLAASGTAPTRADLRLLERYEARNGAEQCRYGCGDCAAACPAGVPIPDVLRARMYGEDYGDVAFARETYAGLGGAASACTTCTHQACANACAHGLDIPALTLRAHRVAG